MSTGALERVSVALPPQAVKDHLIETLLVPQIHLLKDLCQKEKRKEKKIQFTVNMNILNILLFKM